MSRIEKFIKQVSTTYSLSEDSVNQMWLDLEDHTCSFIIKSGSRKDQPCGVAECQTHSSKTETTCTAVVKSGKPCGNKTKNSPCCGKHTEKKTIVSENTSEEKSIETNKNASTETTNCNFIMKAGTRKGEACGKQTKQKLCSLHRPKEGVEKKAKVDTTPCALVFKTGERKGEVCGNTTQTCPHHQAVRIRKWGEYSILSDTTILFDKKKQVILGYTQDEKAIFEENDDVRKASLMYDLAFGHI